MYGKGCMVYIKFFVNKCNDDFIRVVIYIMLYFLRYYLFLQIVYILCYILNIYYLLFLVII